MYSNSRCLGYVSHKGIVPLDDLKEQCDMLGIPYPDDKNIFIRAADAELIKSLYGVKGCLFNSDGNEYTIYGMGHTVDGVYRPSICSKGAHEMNKEEVKPLVKHKTYMPINVCSCEELLV